MLTVAQAYATLIDQGRFDELAPLMSEDCRYRYWEGNYQGRENIISMFRQNHEFAAKSFEEARYSSSVFAEGMDAYKILLFDKFRLRGEWHESVSEQILKIHDGLIMKIEEFEMAGQPAS